MLLYEKAFRIVRGISFERPLSKTVIVSFTSDWFLITLCHIAILASLSAILQYLHCFSCIFRVRSQMESYSSLCLAYKHNIYITIRCCIYPKVFSPDEMSQRLMRMATHQLTTSCVKWKRDMFSEYSACKL